MKIHPAFKKVIAAARRDAQHPLASTTQAQREKVREAIALVQSFVDDNHDFIEFYNDDAGLT